MNHLIVISALVGLAACGEKALQLEIHRPCNGSSLDSNGVAFVELGVASPELASPVRATFGAGDAKGSLDGIAAVKRATIEVTGRAADSGGGVGAVVVAGGVGYVDLVENQDRLSIIAGQVSTFVRVTPTSAVDAACADQLAARVLHTASMLDDGRVLLAGGSDDNGPQSSSEIYDPREGVFEGGPPMSVARMGHTATVLANGRVAVAGGYDATNKASALLETYDGDAFVRPVNLGEARAYHTATLLRDGRVLLAGGIGSGGAVLATSVIYDPATERTSDGPALTAARARHAAVLVDDAVVALVGGIDGVAVIGLVEFIDVAGDESIAGPSLRTPRSDAAVGYVADKNVMVVAGGYTERIAELGRGTATANIEVVSLESDLAGSSVVCSSGALSVGRAAASIAPMPRGFLIAGGSVSPGVVGNTADAFTFDSSPCQPHIEEVGELYASRFGAAATVLVSGDILVTGGAGIAKGALSSRKAAEIFIVPR